MNGFKICYVSSEVAPFANSERIGDLANYAKALPISLKETDQDIRLMMPKYKSINERKFTLREVIRLREVPVALEEETREANGKTAFLPNSKVHVYFLSLPDYFDRKGIYNEPGNNKDYPDNALRFAYFCKGILETLKLLYWQPDIIHCNDWSTALIPYFLKTKYADDEFFSQTRTVLSINNIDQQGVFDASNATPIGISKEELAKGGPFAVKKGISFLRAGLHYADQIAVTGLGVAENLLEKNEIAGELSDLIQKRESDITGTGKGTSYLEWDPVSDKHITFNFDAHSPERKDQNKEELQSDFNMNSATETPLIAVLGDLSENSGFDIIMEVLSNLLKKDLNCVVMPAGPTYFIDALEAMEEQFAGKFKLVEKHDKKLAHRITAAADFMLIPSKTGMGGENHLIGLRYGAIPILMNIGDFPDDINQYDSERNSGNGFFFQKANKTAIEKAIQAALKVFRNKEEWLRLQSSVMSEDHSWRQVSERFLEIYDRAGR